MPQYGNNDDIVSVVNVLLSELWRIVCSINLMHRNDVMTLVARRCRIFEMLVQLRLGFEAPTFDIGAQFLQGFWRILPSSNGS